MRVFYHPEELSQDYPRPIVTIGNFDGVHLGHQRLMSELVDRAKKVGGTSTVITFHPHPLQVMAPGNAPRQIQTLHQKLGIIESLGIQLVIIVPFDRQFAQIKARDFATKMLWEQLHIQEVYVGPNFAFGHRREGSFKLLKEIGEQKGFLVAKMHQMQFRGMRVSSTAIRQALISGQVSLARRLLGRAYALEGAIVHGTATGTEIQVPTANMQTPNELIPRMGIYITMLTVDERRLKAVTNIGVRPTFNAEDDILPLTIETHVLGFEQDIYNQKVALEFLLRLRDERRFPNTSTLVAQIQKDVGRARRFFRWLEKLVPTLTRQGLRP